MPSPESFSVVSQQPTPDAGTNGGVPPDMLSTSHPEQTCLVQPTYTNPDTVSTVHLYQTLTFPVLVLITESSLTELTRGCELCSWVCCHSLLCVNHMDEDIQREPVRNFPTADKLCVGSVKLSCLCKVMALPAACSIMHKLKYFGMGKK